MEYQDYKIPLITNAMISLTDQCTCACPYCFEERSPHRMAYDTLYDVVQFLIQNAEQEGIQPRIVFFGGEPTMEWDSLIVPIVTYIRKEYAKPCVLSMTTNMTLLTKERIQFMKDNQMTALYSIDGPKDVHDTNRPMRSGESCYDRIIQVVPDILRAFPNATARMTLSKSTCHRLSDSIQHIENIGFKELSVLPNLFADWTDEDYAMVASQMIDYADYVIESFRGGHIPIHFQQLGIAYSQIMLINRYINNGQHRVLHKCTGCGKCGFGNLHFACINYCGDVYGCFHPGSISHDSPFYLGDIYDGVDTSKTVKLIESCSPDLLRGISCDECKLSPVCDGGCAPNNYVYSGDVNVVPPMYCHWNQAVLDAAVHICDVLGKEENKLFRKYFRWRVTHG